MAIKNTVCSDIWSAFVIVKSIFDCRLSGVIIPTKFKWDGIQHKVQDDICVMKTEISLPICTVCTEMLDPWWPIQYPSKTLIRLCWSAGWSESLMGQHANLFLLLDTSSNVLNLRSYLEIQPQNTEFRNNVHAIHSIYKITVVMFVCLFCCFTSQVNSYGHCETVSSPNHTFSWAGLNKRLTSNSCTYFRL